ncbi:hypothetical protein GCM10009092_12790 [Bowmanella denitrificans]|uniref:diguanylate cyclase n=1 Tax=Bowmanella denitrificans TaxID=366582 RepID=A0ABP3GMF1_9ALTE
MPFGDKVLQGLAALLKTEIRQIDVLARIGGEEFALLMPNVGIQQARLGLERLRQALAGQGILVNNQRYAVTISIGAAQAGELPVESLLQKVDNLLYQAKHKGRNRVETDFAQG